MVPVFFREDLRNVPYTSYDEYLTSLFYAVDATLSAYLEELRNTNTAIDGNVKNILYPDLESACDISSRRMFEYREMAPAFPAAADTEPQEQDPELLALFSDLAEDMPEFLDGTDNSPGCGLSPAEMLGFIYDRGAASASTQAAMPLLHLIKTQKLSDFSTFALTCALLASTQTSYGSIFQIVNQNGSLTIPTLEACGRVFFGRSFSINACYGIMSATLDQLRPILPMNVPPAMPFSTVLSLDKRLIDYLFGQEPNKLDPQFERFCSSLTTQEELDPFLANKDKLEGLSIAFDSGTRLFSMFGDEGSGRKFTIRHFCQEKSFGCISVNGAKLFSYDYSFVEGALWTIARESIFFNACAVLDNLDFREDEREKFFGYMDLAVSLLSKYAAAVFTLSELKLPVKEFTSLDFAQFELPTPNVGERELLWSYYAKGCAFAQDVDLVDMAAKFLFTPGKIRNSIRLGKSLSEINQAGSITKKWLFEACYGQMKHELTQKATKVSAVYTWDDIIMPPEQRQSLEYACHQMRFRKQVYENWDYNSKYPYGRGLSVLLFGHPGTGKTMCAQVLANALNLELYRVDLSKVIDKYVGETEKSISMIFREAKKCNVVLFFDECDTLFGKRTDSGGSGESANNNKTAHLLQEIEAYDGVSVLATNFKHNIDPAFFRRMKFIVEFAFPDVETRYNIWKATIPKKTPLHEDVDLRFLAEKFEFVGGNIKNCILNAGFFAAADPPGDEMNMKHLLLAVKYELVKTGAVFTRSNFEPYASLIM